MHSEKMDKRIFKLEQDLKQLRTGLDEFAAEGKVHLGKTDAVEQRIKTQQAEIEKLKGQI